MVEVWSNPDAERRLATIPAQGQEAFLALIVAQVAHFIEEYVFRLYDVFAPARFVSGLLTDNLALGFAIANTLVVLFRIWCYVARVRPNHPPVVGSPGSGRGSAGSAMPLRSSSSPHLFVVMYEEPTLQRNFDGDYQAYCKRVSRWWPKL